MSDLIGVVENAYPPPRPRAVALVRPRAGSRAASHEESRYAVLETFNARERVETPKILFSAGTVDRVLNNFIAIPFERLVRLVGSEPIFHHGGRVYVVN